MKMMKNKERKKNFWNKCVLKEKKNKNRKNLKNYKKNKKNNINSTKNNSNNNKIYTLMKHSIMNFYLLM